MPGRSSSSADPVRDESQLAVITADIDDRLIVTAAAGQGKTATLISRIEHLTGEGTDPDSEILFLSFSRAAVEEARSRSTRAGLGSAGARTFDSLAATILSEAGEYEAATGFEGRIRKATEIVRAGEAGLDSIEHVFIDESQDLVGDRAEFVLAVLRSLPDAGFTVVGDPLQGIFDFQLKEKISKSPMTSSEFLTVLESEFGARRTSLSGHYRAQSDRMAGLIPVGEMLRTMLDAQDAAANAHALLDSYRRKFEGERFTASRLELLSGYLEPAGDEISAVLTHTNYAALRASENLHEIDVPHVVRRRTRDMGLERWLASIFLEAEARKYSRDEIERLAADGNTATPPDIWRRLKSAENDRRDFRTLDIRQLNRRLRNTQTPLGLTVGDSAGVVVSTVHRSKGLEFDHVIHLTPPSDSPYAETTWENLKEKYVATSRPRESLHLVPEMGTERGYPHIEYYRWVERGFHGKGRTYVRRIELMNEDIVAERPFGASPENAAESQELLRSNARVGAPVTLTADEDLSNRTYVVYRISTEDGKAIGATGHIFGNALSRIFRLRDRRRWPVRFTGARVASVETTVGDPAVAESAGLGRSGFWLVPRLTGLITPQWPKKTGS